MKIKLFGDAVIVVSNLKRDDIKKANKFCKDALTLKKKLNDDKAQPVFTMMLGGGGSLNSNGVVFDSVTEDGFACTTLCGNPVPMTQSEKAEQFLEQYATALAHAEELETQITNALHEHNALIDRVSTSVEIVG